MLRKLILAGAILALVVDAASAQMPMPGMTLKNEPKQLTPEERAKQKAIDEAYRAASRKIPNKAANDPWSGIRPNPAQDKR